MQYGITKTIIDIFCTIFLLSLVWMWVVGPIVDEWLWRRKERRTIEERLMSRMRYKDEARGSRS